MASGAVTARFPMDIVKMDDGPAKLLTEATGKPRLAGPAVSHNEDPLERI
ncbi:hypothetical protein [Rhizobium hidalgonense]